MSIYTAAGYVIKSKNSTAIYKNVSFLLKYYSTQFKNTNPLVTMNSNDNKDKENQTGVEQELLLKHKENINKVKKCIEIMLIQGRNVPENINSYKMNRLMDMTTSKIPIMLSRWAREESTKLFTYQNVMERKKIKSKLYTHINYSLWSNSMFIRCNTHVTSRFYRCHLANKYSLSTPIVFDCGFQLDDRMIARMVSELSDFYFYNRTFPDPFNIYLCNVRPEFKKELYKNSFIRPMVEDVHITEESYLKLFPHNKLVYLSPDARKTLNHVDDDAIYIIGALCDPNEEMPYSLAKSKDEGIQSYSLPVWEHLSLIGSRSLSAYVTGQVLLNYREQPNSTWTDAFSCVPERLCRIGTHSQKKRLRIKI